MDYSNMTVDECGALANAIVLQAIDDYEKAIAVRGKDRRGKDESE